MDIAGLLRDYQANILDLGTFARLSLRLTTGDSGGQLNVPNFLTQTTLNVEQLLSEVNSLVRGKLAIASIPNFTVTWADSSLLMDVSIDRVQQLEAQGMFQNSGHLYFIMSAENPLKSSEQIGNSENLRNSYGIKDSEILQDLEKFLKEGIASIYIESLIINWLTPPAKSSPVQAQIESALTNYPNLDELDTILAKYAPLSHLQEQGLSAHIPKTGITNAEVAEDAAIARSKIAGLIDSLEKLASDITGKQSAGDYAPLILATDFLTHIQSRGTSTHIPDTGITNSEVANGAAIALSKINGLVESLENLAIQIVGKQPIGDYAPLTVVKDFTTHTQARGDGSHIPDTGITDLQVAPGAAIAWNKIAVPTLEHGCKIFPTGNVAIGVSGWSVLAFNTVVFDSDGLFSAADGGIKAKVAGYYLIETAIKILDTGTVNSTPGIFSLGIKTAGTIRNAGSSYTPISGSGSNCVAMSAVQVQKLNAGDLIQAAVQHFSGKSSLAVYSVNVPSYTWLGAYLIR